MLTAEDIKTIEGIVGRAVAPLATKEELKTLATKVDMSKGFKRLERMIK